MKTPLLGAGIIPVPVQASGVGVSDPGGFYGGGPLTLEEVLALIGAGLAPDSFLLKWGGGVGNVQDHGTLGATETVDLANGNAHKGVLDQACTLTTTGWTNLKDCQIRLALTQDGTGNWLPTVSGVTWVTAAPVATAAGSVIHIVLFSDDGGTTIWGAVLGGTTPTDAMVPYLIESGETFTVPVKKQALFNYPITVDPGGSLVVNGYLLMVT